MESDRGRGGGLRLEQGWSLSRVHLNELEAIGLLVSLTIAEKVGSPIRRVAVITYQDQRAGITDREIELLYYSVPVWCVLAWDRLRGPLS